ncbi:Thermostable beta-glucosidase B [compost metagenome]
MANTGDRPGSTVVQLYVSDEKSSEPRPAKELKSFEKVHLQPGETRSVTLLLDARAFAWYREAAQHWLVEAGSFTISLGQSASDLPLSASLARATTLMLPV